MKKYFITGLITLLPLAITVISVIFVINLLTKPFMGIVSHVIRWLPIESDQMIDAISHLFIFVIMFFTTIGIGLLAHKLCIHKRLHIGDRILGKIPFIKTIYKTAREIFNSLLSSEKNTFQQVVLVTFPHEGSYTLGLVSREAPKTCSEAFHEELISILIPGTPSPMTGFLIVRPRKDLIYLNMKVEDALKYIVSCGAASPKPVEK